MNELRMALLILFYQSPSSPTFFSDANRLCVCVLLCVVCHHSHLMIIIKFTYDFSQKKKRKRVREKNGIYEWRNKVYLYVALIVFLTLGFNSSVGAWNSFVMQLYIFNKLLKVQVKWTETCYVKIYVKNDRYIFNKNKLSSKHGT